MNRPQDPIPIDRLRDRISELELQRTVDQREISVADALLSGVERMQAARSRPEVLAALAQTLTEALRAKQVFVVGDGAEAFFGQTKVQYEVLHPAASGLRTNEVPRIDADLMKWLSRRRNIRDLSGVEIHPSLRALLGPLGSMISAPFKREGGQIVTVICFHSEEGFFDNDAMRVLRRLTDLVAHAMRSIRMDDRHEVLASVVEYADVPVMLVEPFEVGGRIVYVNEAFEKMAGFTWEDMSGQAFQSKMPTPSPERLSLRYHFQSGKPGRFTVWNKHKNGRHFLNEISLAPIRNRDGSLRYMLATHADVTKQMAHQREIKILEQRLEVAMEAVSNAILVMDTSGDTIYRNSAMSELLLKLGQATADEDLAAQTLLQLCPRTGQDIDVDCADGSAFLLRSFKSREGGKVFTATDITEIREAKRTLKQRAVAMDSTAEGIVITDTTAKISYANPSFAKLFGAGDPDQIIGQKWCAAFAEEDVARLATEIRPKVAANGSGMIEMMAPHPDGPLTYEVSVTAIDDEKRIVVAHDVTRRIEYEAARANLEQRLQEFEKNESIGRLAAGVAHDFNNLLAVINGHAALLNARTPTDKVQLYSDRINEASSRAAKMINRFLDLGMSSDSQSMIDLRTLLTESDDLLRSILSAETKFNLDLEQTEMEMLCFPSELLRVALNLVQNAQDALDGKPGEISQSLRRVAGADLDPKEMRVGLIDPDLNYACYAVRDTGCGIPEAIQDRLFRDHCSTKGQRGSGIGMMAIAEIVLDHEGAIRIETGSGAGTEIQIYLPLSNLSPTVVTEGEIGSIRLDGKLVLVVDDDIQVGESMTAFLERLGAEVAFCDQPEEALDTICEDPGLWSMVVSDYNMPGMNGGQLARAAREADPDLPILIVTALARKLSDPNLSNTNITGLLGKPVDLNALAHLIDKHGRDLPEN